uniref:Uncharacterized protein n=1 Tax=Anguilla anguilla TaxID=7936 RepID=A0A0E9SJV9_ANGAN
MECNASCVLCSIKCYIWLTSVFNVLNLCTQTILPETKTA